MINLSLVNKYWSKKIDCLSKFFSMEKIYLGVLLLIINYSLSATTYYVSPNGSDNNSGSSSQPFATWQKGVNVAAAGDIVYIRGGIYYTSGSLRTTGYCGVFIQNKNGTSDNLISILAYPGEIPILDCSGMTQSGDQHIGISIESSSYLHLKGLRIRNVKAASGYTATGISTYRMNNSKLELISVSGTQGPGFGIDGNNNLILNCDAFDNYDSQSGGEHGDGFIFGHNDSRTTNSLYGCRSWNNSDDGFDTYGNEGTIIWEKCWSFNNGYGSNGDGAGFKLGATHLTPLSTPQKVLINCLAANNKGIGFDQSEGNVLINLFNNTSFSNSRGFEFSSGGNLALVFKNNLSYANDNPDTFQSNMIRINNSWQNGISVSSSDFLTLDDSGIKGERNSDGSLPNISFLHLASSSDMVDAGVYVGQPYNGDAPDIGCFESGGTASAPVPVYVSSSVQNAAPSVVEINFNLNLASIVPSASAFNVSVNSSSRAINSVAVSGTKVTLTLSSPIVYDDVITVAYSKPSSNPLQTSSGGQVASFSAKTVTNNVNAPKPVFTSAYINNESPAWLVTTYNTTLASITPSASSFTVRVNSVTRAVNSVLVTSNKVCLTLSSSVTYGDVITISYTKPSSNPIQSTSGTQADSYTSQPVTNNVLAQVPVYLSSAVENASPSTVEITYSLTLANIVPAASAFNVQVNSTSRSINSVTVSGTKVTLTLASPVAYGDVVTFSYTKPSSNPIQTSAGAQAASVSAQSVTNKVGAPAPVYTGSSVENANPSRIVLVYNSTLANIVPPASAFTVNVNSTRITVNSVAISGANVYLNLASQVSYGDVITFSYTKPSSNPIQTSAGGQAASLSTQTVKNNVLPPVPVFVSSSIESTTPSKIDIIYSLTLANVVPPVSAFNVNVNSTSRNVTSVVVSGTKVTLTLASAVAFGDAVTVEYTKPSSSPLQSASGAQAESSGVKSVLNKVGAPVPILSGATVENASPSKLEMTFNLTLANIVPSASTFSVKINNTVRAVSNISISGTKVVLTLASPVLNGDAVTLAYTKPVSNPLQGTAGGQVASFSAVQVTNRVLPPQPVYVSSAIENSNPSRVDITYNLTLANILPPISAFSIKINSNEVTVNNVTISGNKVYLTLDTPVKTGDVVTMSYTKPTNNPIQTPAGGEAASTSTQNVANNVGNTNSPPVIVVDYKTNSYSGFVNELDASGSYDINRDNLTYTWTVPNNIPVSTTMGPKIQYLSPIVYESINVEFTLTVSDGKTTRTSSIPVNILPYKPELEVAEVISVNASSYQAPNYPYNILDGNIATMWSVNGDNEWIVLELKEMFNVQHVKLAFHSGQKKESYFDILGSNDMENWEPVLTKSNSCAFSGDMQVFDFPPSKTGKEFKYIKLVGHCNSTDTWNYISEFKIFGYRHRYPSSYENQIVKIFPNPASEYINVKIEEANITPDFIRIISLSGKIMHEERLDPGINEFTMPIDLIKGIYLIQMGEGKITLFSQKLVVR